MEETPVGSPSAPSAPSSTTSWQLGGELKPNKPTPLALRSLDRKGSQMSSNSQSEPLTTTVHFPYPDFVILPGDGGSKSSDESNRSYSALLKKVSRAVKRPVKKTLGNCCELLCRLVNEPTGLTNLTVLTAYTNTTQNTITPGKLRLPQPHSPPRRCRARRTPSLPLPPNNNPNLLAKPHHRNRDHRRNPDSRYSC